MTEYFMAVLKEFKLVEKDSKTKKFNATEKGKDLVDAFMD